MALAQGKSVRNSRKPALDRLFSANRATATMPWSWYQLGQLTGIQPGHLVTVAQGHAWRAAERLLDEVLAGAPPDRIRRLGTGLKAAVTRRKNQRARKGRGGGRRVA